MKKRSLVRAAVFFIVSTAMVVIAANAAFAEEDQQYEIPLPPPGEGKIAGIGGSGTANYIPKFVSSTSLGNSILYELGGNVGIGTTSPLSKLHVAGGLVLTNGDGAGFPVGSGGVLRAYYDQADNFGSIWAFDYTAQRSRNILLNEPGGNVGIGLRAPEVSLDTAGTIRAQGDVYATAGSGLELGMSSGHGLVRPYNRSTGSYLTMDMDAKEYYLSVSGAPRVTIDTIGRVGIGTTNPAEKLVIAGAPASGTFLLMESTAATPQNWAIQVGTDGKYHVTDATAGVGRLTIDRTGNVGIGTTSPEYKLQIETPAGATADNSLELTKAGGYGGTHFRQYYNSEADYGLRIGWVNDVLNINQANGNVGIGTTNPSQKLDVAGYVKGQSGLCIGDDCRTSWPSGGGGNITGGGSTNYLAKFTGSTSIGNGAIYDNGNVGIGTISPISPLHVEGVIASTSPVVRITNTGQGHGILVRTSSTTDKNAAIEAQAMSSSGNTYGVFGITNSTAAAGGSTVGVYGLAQNSRSTGGATLGVLGESKSIPDSGADTSNGLFGWANINDGGSGPNYGRTFGVWGETDSKGPPNGQSGPVSGITGVATNSSPDSLSHGVVGRAVSSSTSSFGVYYQGGISGTGLMSSIVRTNDGPRLIYATQSPEPWVEDYGEGKLKNGYVRINLDPVYLQTVAVDANHPFRVFVTPTGTAALNGMRVIKDATGFRVQELNGGKSNATFDWRIVAKRKDLADRRLDISEGAYSDPTLYPERFPNAKLTHEDFQTPEP